MKNHLDGVCTGNTQLIVCLHAQADLCERIARNCFDELTAQKYRKLADECRASASEVGLTNDTVAAKWPAIVAF